MDVQGTANSEVLTGTNDDDTITGLGGDDILQGLDGNDSLDGGDGNDILDGGEGNDTLGNPSQGGAGRDIFLGGAGNDVIYSVDTPASFFSGVVAPQSDIVDAGIGDDEVTAGRLDNLDGGDGFDRLAINFGFNGTMTAPAVTIMADDTGAGSANDGTSFRNFEFVNFNLTDGNDVSNTGNLQASISGGGGNDTITTGSANDVVYGEAGNDVINAGDGDNTLGGGAGNDTITAGSGADSLSVNAQTEGADTVNLGGGNDTVTVFGDVGFTGQVRLTFTSSEVGNGSATESGTVAGQDGGLAVRFQIENADGELTGAVSRYDDEGVTFVQGQQGLTFDVRDISGAARGDQFVGVVLGTSGDDALSFFPPFRANDPYYYNAGMGNDTVNAGTGNDFLVGGGGNDTLNGNDGNDSFLGGAGTDTLNGGAGNDRLDGGLGDDRLNGGAGDDTFLVDSRSDTVAEAANGGSDTVLASATYVLRAGVEVETLSTTDQAGTTNIGLYGNEFAQTITGNDGAGTLSGGAGDDILIGNGGSDILNGGVGQDRLSGGAGNDAFVFDAALTNRNADTITDFGAASGNDDTIQLDNAVFTQLGAEGRLSANQFVANAQGLARDGDDHVVYNTSSGELLYDSNGSASGGRTLVATLANAPTLTAGDFFVV